MIIKANRNLYKNALIALAALLIFMGTLAYFLGFTVNMTSLCLYFLFIAIVIITSLALFLMIDTLNNKLIIFDNEKIIERNSNSEKIVVYYSQILNTKYCDRIDFLRENIDFGYVEIKYRLDPKDKQPLYVNLYLSKKHYEQFLLIMRSGLH